MCFEQEVLSMLSLWIRAEKPKQACGACCCYQGQSSESCGLPTVHRRLNGQTPALAPCGSFESPSPKTSRSCEATACKIVTNQDRPTRAYLTHQTTP
jgi:hypothetical protein